MGEPMSFEEAVSQLRSIQARAMSQDRIGKESGPTIKARHEVIGRYQPMFSRDNLDKLTEEDFRQFLLFKNNRHWVSLQRLGPAICADMKRLREALATLLDETQPIRDRLNRLVPPGKPCFVPRLHKAVLTPILLVTHPDQYGVWNSVSEAALKALSLWPELDRKKPFGERYERVNAVLTHLAKVLGVDLWTLDSLLWGVVTDSGVPAAEGDEPGTEEALGESPAESQRFGLERHLHEFLRDNWRKTAFAGDWSLYEEDGDPEAGYEYPCAVGRIDLLARHKTKRGWLVIELKRNQTSDQTVGQLARYMGWVKRHLAEASESVEGLVIAHEADESIRYALSALPSVRLQLYEVEFRLRAAAEISAGRQDGRGKPHE
jgi:hypothetical protein